MPTNYPTPPTKMISWSSEVLSADPDWNYKYQHPIVYEFSNGRTFELQNPVYGTATST